MIIYKIQNNINGKIYIGLTTKALSERIAEHIAENKSYIQKALNKYGIQSFDISVIDSAESRDVLCEKEQYWIRHYDCKAHKGYNLTDGGDGLINPVSSVREQISNTLKQNQSRYGYNKRGTGTIKSKETKQKLSESLKQVLSSPEIRKKMSDAGKGKVISEETKRKISEAKKGKKRKDAHLFSERALAYAGKPDYVNPMKGKKRPDLAERNKKNKGRKANFKDPLERARKISETRKKKYQLKKRGETKQ